MSRQGHELLAEIAELHRTLEKRPGPADGSPGKLSPERESVELRLHDAQRRYDRHVKRAAQRCGVRIR